MGEVDARRELAEHGFTRVAAVLAPGELASLREALERSQPAGFASRRAGAVFALRNVLRLVPEASEAAAGALQRLAGAVTGEPVTPTKAILFDKVVGANWKIPWHQDRMIAVEERRDVAGFTSWSVKAGIPHVQPPTAVLQSILALRLFLDDQGPESGALAVIPGSHAGGKLEPADVERIVRESEPRLCTGAAGDVLAMRPLLLHTSAPARRPGHRRVLHIEYSARELPGGLSWYR